MSHRPAILPSVGAGALGDGGVLGVCGVDGAHGVMSHDVPSPRRSPKHGLWTGQPSRYKPWRWTVLKDTWVHSRSLAIKVDGNLYPMITEFVSPREPGSSDRRMHVIRVTGAESNETATSSVNGIAGHRHGVPRNSNQQRQGTR